VKEGGHCAIGSGSRPSLLHGAEQADANSVSSELLKGARFLMFEGEHMHILVGTPKHVFVWCNYHP
jgi:hypothetical protein